MSSSEEEERLSTECERLATMLQKKDLDEIATNSSIKAPSATRNVKSKYIRYLLNAGKSEMLNTAAKTRSKIKDIKTKLTQAAKNARKRNDRQRQQEIRIQTDGIPQVRHDRHESEQFMDIPDQEETRELYRKFFEATNNAAVRHYTCGVCGRYRMESEAHFTTKPISAIPNRHRLKSHQEDARPVYVEGLLLEPKGCIFRQGEETEVRLCKDCLDSLKKGGDEDLLPPRFSYANGLWYGPLPEELRVLTLPEILLISLNYPRVYLVKLQPKRGANRYDPETLQKALVGNVISFEQNTKQMAEMTMGNLMPRKPAILASLVSVALVSVGPLKKSWLANTFKVRRAYVWRALLWLKKNNRHYNDVKISEDNLAQLPEDDIPASIYDFIRRDDNPDTADKEREGYVPTDVGNDTGSNQNYDMKPNEI